MGFIIQTPWLRLNSSTNMAYSPGRMYVMGKKSYAPSAGSRSLALLLGAVPLSSVLLRPENEHNTSSFSSHSKHKAEADAYLAFFSTWRFMRLRFLISRSFRQSCERVTDSVSGK